jgi:peptidoglycan/xylan/chitin deacetylase (PgdA/CDA1 family)
MMFSDKLISGDTLPEGTLCLTFDDGPGDDTLDIAHFLNRLGIAATFFMVGENVRYFDYVPPRLATLGHLVGNHTYTHPKIDDEFKGSLIAQLTRTDAALCFDGESGMPFRPPYGEWSASAAAILNSDKELARTHYGPIGWDIDGEDWKFWMRELSPVQCADHYMEKIQQKKKGIVLMHDASPINNNRTLEMIQLLIPELAKNFKFARLDNCWHTP